MKKKNTTDMTVVIGCSRFGATIASQNSKAGKYTAIIDMNSKAFRKLDTDYSGYTIEGNAMDKNVLNQSNIEKATEVDIMTNDDNTNIFLASYVLHFYNAPLIIVRLQDEKKASLLDDSRIKIISPALLSIETYHKIIDEENNKEE